MARKVGPVPLPERPTHPVTGPGPRRDLPALRAAAVAVLTDPALAGIVDLVAYPDDGGIVVANADGSSWIDRADPDGPARVLRGRNPVACQDPLAHAGAAAEVADPSPPNARQSYPYAGRRLVSAFSDPRAPLPMPLAYPGPARTEPEGEPDTHPTEAG